MGSLALVRHGQTDWNRKGVFTGWADIPLNEQGRREAAAAGRCLRRLNISWHAAVVSELSRAAQTWTALVSELQTGAALDATVDWRLNERHVGDLEGRTHEETAARLSADQVESWRWGWDDRPPAMKPSDTRSPFEDQRYRDLRGQIRLGESLRDVCERVHPWVHETLERVRSGQNIIAVSHGTTIRAIRCLVERPAAIEIPELRQRNGQVTIYVLGETPQERSSGGAAADELCVSQIFLQKPTIGSQHAG